MSGRVSGTAVTVAAAPVVALALYSDTPSAPSSSTVTAVFVETLGNA
jgi:hypothetical protein